MVIDEDWGISRARIEAFFCNQADVSADGDGYSFRQCRITLAPENDRAIGPWPVSRTRVRMEGPDEDVMSIHHRFFLQFLSAGG